MVQLPSCALLSPCIDFVGNMQEDPYAAFKTAFEEQRCELQRLYARVSKLEEVNNDVLTFVKQTGNLPGLKSDGTVHEPCQCTFKDNELGLENITASSSICHKTDTLRGTHLNEPTVLDEDTAALISDTSAKSGCTRADTSQATVITDIIKQQTTELNKALQNLGLEPSKRTQLLDQVQTNLSSILSTQLSRHGPTLTVQPVPESHDFIAGAGGGGSSAPRSALPIDSPLHSSLGCSFGEGTLSAPCPASTDCSHEIIDFQSTSQGVAHLLGIPESVTPVCQSGVTTSPTTVNVQQRRRREELLRLNQRMLRPSSGSKAATIHVDVPCDYMQASHLKTPTPGSTWSTLPTPLPRTKCVLTHVPCAKDEILTHPVSTLQQLTALSSYRTVVPMNVKEKLVATEHFCPCGDRMHCPLSPAKQQRLASDPRVIRGFTLVVAFFRGHFVRQLLATHKVCDLIRTVKDTAKLALSMHVERQMSSSKFSDSDHADPQTNGGLSNEELVLEMRLLAQLRGALAQLHDIFFSWSLRNQIELMHISRSLPQRNKRAKARSIREEARYVDSQSSEVSNETWVHRGALEPRRRWNSSASQWIPRDPNEWPVKMMRRVPEKSECSGSSKLTKLIDSVRRSWPTNRPVGQKKNEPFPIANLTALAYGDSPVDVKQMSNKKPAIKRPLRRSHSSSGGSNNRQPSTEGSNTAQPPIHTRQSLENTSLEPLTYTPVRLYTPPSPNTLTLESTVPADTEMRMPLHQTAPPLQLGQSSLFRVRQLSQNLRAERRQHHELQSADKLILPSTTPRCVTLSSFGKRAPVKPFQQPSVSTRARFIQKEIITDSRKDVRIKQPSHTPSSDEASCTTQRRKVHVDAESERALGEVQEGSDVPFDSSFNLPYSVPGPLLEASAFPLAHAESERTHSMRRANRHSHCTRHLTRGKRLISRPVGNLPTIPNAPHSAGDWYPVRRRIIAAKYPDFFPSEPPQPIFEYEQRVLTPNNRSLSDLSSATTNSTKQGEVAHESAPVRCRNDELHPPPPNERIMDLPSHPINSPSYLRATWSIESGDAVTPYSPY
ncbi:hypothetical protein EG68_07660 [Paragonimus skrjabini miyazakii]|uniref:Uncharacterized protein n=1 Tax=Paragonimus skrjabini miyazakii TaxID=59628 RepID=A0A8S9YTU4_9TREM|nr:hypothetical protein EG68_07660 [Paragonimus skrjabini miyazakii]